MEQLKHMKQCLISAVEGQLGNLHNADAKELGEAVDMIKDLEEAIYYCTIVKSMEDSEKQPKQHHYYYTEPTHYNMRYYEERPMYYRDMDRGHGRMYYDGNGGNSSSGSMGGSTRGYTEREYPIEIRDYREGRSPLSRRMYMESKELHKDKAYQMQELEKYMRELSDDLTEMVENSSPEEKQMLSKKLSTLATKIV